MFKTVEDLIIKIDMTPYVKDRLKDKLKLIEDKNIAPMEQLRQLLNFICPNVKKLIKNPNRFSYGSTDEAIAMYLEACDEYMFENSQIEFPYTSENLERLKKYIKEIE